MKSLAIDFGTKKCGLAVSDDTGSVAMPYKIVPNWELLAEVGDLLKNKKFEKIIVGESVNSAGEHNTVFAEVKRFVEKLKVEFELELNGGLLEIIYEKEFMTSMHARAEDGKREVDDRAAALILQRYLDRQNKLNKKEFEKFVENEEEKYFDDEGD